MAKAIPLYLAGLFLWLPLTLPDHSLRLTRVVPPSSPWNAVVGNTVLATVQVDGSGNVTKVRVLQGIPPFAEETVRVISQWKFEPARLEGRTVAAEISIVVMFRPHAFGNLGVGGPSLGFTTPELPNGNHPVLPLSIFDPAWPIGRSLNVGVVVFELEINQDGSIDGIRVVRDVAGTTDFAKETVRLWKFAPAVIDRKPLRSTTIIAISFVTPVVDNQ
jgi:TonB family protein